ncbi:MULTISPECIES: hypothetical protein [unclassified Microcoleus]|uniref:hypothetical protein n=1 Tax=unclassified Microcoleus TaxID=2642155 RepID=UPI002FD334C7
MLNWNEIFSGLALALAGFAYAFAVCFIFFCTAPFWDTVIAIAGALVGTVATYWVLTSSLPSLGILALMFLSQAVTVGFAGAFLPEGMYAGVFLNAGTLALGITSRYTTFSQQKTMLILVLFVALFLPVWAADFWRRNGISPHNY